MLSNKQFEHVLNESKNIVKENSDTVPIEQVRQLVSRHKHQLAEAVKDAKLKIAIEFLPEMENISNWIKALVDGKENPDELKKVWDAFSSKFNEYIKQ